jgi:hypothetical protein
LEGGGFNAEARRCGEKPEKKAKKGVGKLGAYSSSMRWLAEEAEGAEENGDWAGKADFTAETPRRGEKPKKKAKKGLGKT